MTGRTRISAANSAMVIQGSSARHTDGGRLVQILYGHPDEERALDWLLMAFSADGANRKSKSPASAKIRPQVADRTPADAGPFAFLGPAVSMPGISRENALEVPCAKITPHGHVNHVPGPDRTESRPTARPATRSRAAGLMEGFRRSAKKTAP